MITTHELLAAAKTAQNIPSNYRLARVLDVPESTIKRWNTGKGKPDDFYAAKLADMAGLDAGEVVAFINAERAAEGPMHDLWLRIAERLHSTSPGALGAVLAVILSAGFTLASPDAAAATASPSVTGSVTVCILC